MDFTLKKYKELLLTLLDEKYAFQSFEEFIEKPKKKVVVLRHDVDRRSINATWMAQIEESLNLKASYYFRIVPESNNPLIISQIISMGHEIGYHYEDLGMAKGDYEKAYEKYCDNLEYFRSFYPVKTICMHGSPKSRIDNREIWNKYDYKKDGIIAEPYFDVDYDKVFYITDTGRAWNNSKIIIRDKVRTNFDIQIHSINHMMKLIKDNKFPDQLIINTHSERWFNFGLMWMLEYVFQNLKNMIKLIIVKYRK